MQQSGITKGEQAARVEFDFCYPVPSSAGRVSKRLAGLHRYKEKYAVFYFSEAFWLFETEQGVEMSVPLPNRRSISLQLQNGALINHQLAPS